MLNVELNLATTAQVEQLHNQTLATKFVVMGLTMNITSVMMEIIWTVTVVVRPAHLRQVGIVRNQVELLYLKVKQYVWNIVVMGKTMEGTNVMMETLISMMVVMINAILNQDSHAEVVILHHLILALKYVEILMI